MKHRFPWGLAPIALGALVALCVGGAWAAESENGAAASNKSAGPGVDWPYWRGPEFNSTSRETGLPDEFDFRKPGQGNLRWRRDDLGTRSSPITMNGKVYILCRDQPGTRREGERVVCLNADTGETVWEHRFNVWLSDVPDVRVAWSSVVGDPETGNVYALGVCGYFACYDGETGEVKWDVPMHEQFGLLSTYGGRTNFPIVFEDLVIVSAVVIGWGDMARPAHRFVAFDKRTGEVVWFNGTTPLPDDTTYSAPVIATINGQKQLIFGSGDGRIWALQPRTGAPIWSYALSRRGVNVSPLVIGDTVFVSQSEENIVGTSMGAVAAIDATGKGNITQSGEKWKELEIMVGKTSPLHIDGRLYCFDDGAKLHVLDAKTGEAVVPRKALGTVMRSTPLYADGKIYTFTQDGRWYILKPDPDQGVEILGRGRLARGEEVDASPICSHGRIYLATGHALYCLEDESKEHGVAPAPAAVEEAPVAQDQSPAFVQVIPAESLIKPGEKIAYRVKLFNSKGQFLREADDAQFAVEGPGQIDGTGGFVAQDDARHQAAYVTAKVGDLEGEARVRIVPDLPWQFDFEGLSDPPITWVGARYRHVMRQIDGNHVMVKITTIPKGTRSRAWFGPTDLSNYTIEADVMGGATGDKLPDIGLVAQGYELDMRGEHQELQARSWPPQLRMASTIEFPWQPNQWYRMKMSVQLNDDKAYVRGKVWPKSDKEPDQWSVEAVDEVPNASGAPGLFGNATNAEIYLDNIKVYANP